MTLFTKAKAQAAGSDDFAVGGVEHIPGQAHTGNRCRSVPSTAKYVQPSGGIFMSTAHLRVGMYGKSALSAGTRLGMK